jgi:hypothetical protein
LICAHNLYDALPPRRVYDAPTESASPSLRYGTGFCASFVPEQVHLCCRQRRGPGTVAQPECTRTPAWWPDLVAARLGLRRACIMMCGQTRKSPARRIGTPIPSPGSRPNRESGIPCFPAKSGIGGIPPRFPAKNRESGERELELGISGSVQCGPAQAGVRA